MGRIFPPDPLPTLPCSGLLRQRWGRMASTPALLALSGHGGYSLAGTPTPCSPPLTSVALACDLGPPAPPRTLLSSVPALCQSACWLGGGHPESSPVTGMGPPTCPPTAPGTSPRVDTQNGLGGHRTGKRNQPASDPGAGERQTARSAHPGQPRIHPSFPAAWRESPAPGSALCRPADPTCPPCDLGAKCTSRRGSQTRQPTPEAARGKMGVPSLWMGKLRLGEVDAFRVLPGG